MNKMKICHLIPYIGYAQGGPVISMTVLADDLQKKHCQVTIGSVYKKSDGEKVTFNDDVEVIMCQRSFGGMYRWCPFLARELFSRDFDVVHSHGLWTYPSYLAGRLALKKHLPHVLSPCGMLNARALKRSYWKKAICRVAFQERVLRNAICLHAKSEAEYNDIRRFGLKNPVAVIPNPVVLVEAKDKLEPEEFRKQHGIPDGKKVLLYLGRLHPVKGLKRLLDAWASLDRFHTDWQLVLAGPNENNYLTVLNNRLQSLGYVGSVTFTGGIDNSKKAVAYKVADLFVMPSDFENFGSAIAEAMIAGLPVITTTGTPWKELADKQAGWWVNPTVQALAEALDEGMSLSDSQRRDKGDRAKTLTDRFRPERVAEELIAVYRWLLGHSPRPQFVRIA